MGLLDKFATVQIEADRRITEEDRDFCLRHQDAFDESLPALRRIADAIRAADEEQDGIFAGIKGSADYLSSRRGFMCGEDPVYETMKARNETFITSIVGYFSEKYNVKLDSKEIAEKLIPARPADPEYPYGWRNMPAKEKEDYARRCEEHKEAVEAWERSLRSLPLRYEKIVDEIFNQLGGFSFTEKAMNELLERLWNATHYRYDSTWQNVKAGDERFEIQKNILRFSCGCSYNSYYSSDSEYRINDDILPVLEAVAHSECGEFSAACKYFPGLVDTYSGVQTSEYIPGGFRVESLKFFKNGRLDIKFTSPAALQEFAENYLRRRPAGIEEE